MRRNITLPLILLLITAATWWLLGTLQQEQQIRTQTKRTGPNHYMENFTAIVMNDQGRPKHKLVAARMVHFPDDDRTDLELPDFTFHQYPEQNVWSVKADSGTVLSNGDEIQLQGNVNIHGSDKDHGPLTVKTDRLRILPDNNFAETKQAIHITRGRHTVDAIGAKLYLNDQTLHLLSQVRGTYVPDNKAPDV